MNLLGRYSTLLLVHRLFPLWIFGALFFVTRLVWINKQNTPTFFKDFDQVFSGFLDGFMSVQKDRIFFELISPITSCRKYTNFPHFHKQKYLILTVPKFVPPDSVRQKIPSISFGHPNHTRILFFLGMHTDFLFYFILGVSFLALFPPSKPSPWFCAQFRACVSIQRSSMRTPSRNRRSVPYPPAMNLWLLKGK